MSGIRRSDGRIDVTCWTMNGQDFTACLDVLDNAQSNPDDACQIVNALVFTVEMFADPSGHYETASFALRRELVYGIASGILEGKHHCLTILPADLVERLSGAVSRLVVARAFA